MCDEIELEAPLGILMDVKRLAIHDGPGIRTTLFLKGCPLHCLWCHNPEGMQSKPQLAYNAHQCINCGECAAVCPSGAHVMLPSGHVFLREKCLGCGLCAPRCLGAALRFYGRTVSVSQAYRTAIEDLPFFVHSGGGVTLSGGEPLAQADFCQALLRELKKQDVHLAIDTCGCVAWSEIAKVLPWTDLFLYDIKHIDSRKHRILTGQGNEQILQNLTRLSAAGAGIEIRMPLIPGCNDDRETLHGIGRFLGSLRITRMKLLPYHALSHSKYLSLDMPDTLPGVPTPTPAILRESVDILRGYGIDPTG
jgi:glycyl-radical enzyme activating protein